jgi:hypothetical protein
MLLPPNTPVPACNMLNQAATSATPIQKAAMTKLYSAAMLQMVGHGLTAEQASMLSRWASYL